MEENKMISECYLVEPFTCNQDEPISKVVAKLKEFGQRHIYVVDVDNKPVGIVSVTDILDKIIIAEKNTADFTAKDVMSTGVLVFEDDSRIKQAYKAMVDKAVTDCAVVDEGKMVGTLTLKEALRHITNPEKVVQE
jgi:CBS domain-containing protein